MKERDSERERERVREGGRQTGRKTDKETVLYHLQQQNYRSFKCLAAESL